MKKTFAIMTSIVLGVVLLFGYGLAQRDYRQAGSDKGNQGTNKNNRGHRPPPHPVMTALDSDRDHVISAAEIGNAPNALLTLDKNKDGKLSKEEMRPRPPANRGGNGQQQARGQKNNRDTDNTRQGSRRIQRRQHPPLPALQAMDTDNNQELSAAEIANAPKALLKLDTNGDGRLSHNEVRPKRPTNARR
jgi:Ca2+-binding EF-hand superfamily protein